MIGRFTIWLIRLYQLSFPTRNIIARNLHLPDHPCRFDPTCSQYTIQSIQQYGVGKGLRLGAGQLVRCQGCVRI